MLDDSDVSDVLRAMAAAIEELDEKIGEEGERIDALFGALQERGILPKPTNEFALDPMLRDMVQMPNGDWFDAETIAKDEDLLERAIETIGRPWPDVFPEEWCNGGEES